MDTTFEIVAPYNNIITVIVADIENIVAVRYLSSRRAGWTVRQQNKGIFNYSVIISHMVDFRLGNIEQMPVLKKPLSLIDLLSLEEYFDLRKTLLCPIPGVRTWILRSTNNWSQAFSHSVKKTIRISRSFQVTRNWRGLLRHTVGKGILWKSMGYQYLGTYVII